MTGALLSRDVLGDIHCSDVTERVRAERALDASNPFTRRGQQLTGRGRVADLVTALEIETDPSSGRVEPGTHPVSVFGRTGDGWRRGKRKPADAPERVLDDLAFERELPRILDMREHVSAASCLADGRPAI